MHRQLLRASWLLLLLCCCCRSAAAPACKPQGLLMLDEPHPPPYRVSLPFCEKYQCSCCNASHALTIQRSVRSVMLDDELSLPCKAGLVMLACKTCDPEVGVGNTSTVCLSTCNEVFTACSEDYFAYDESSGLITPCTSAVGGMLVCSQLAEVVQGGAEFCKAAGHIPTPPHGLGEPCFDGRPVGPDKCSSTAPAAARATKQQQQGRSPDKQQKKPRTSDSAVWWWPFGKLKRRQRQQLAAAAELVLGGAVSACMAVAVVLLLQRLMQVPIAVMRKSGVNSNVRDRLAQAAEARAAHRGDGPTPPAAHAAQAQKRKGR